MVISHSPGLGQNSTLKNSCGWPSPPFGVRSVQAVSKLVLEAKATMDSLDACLAPVEKAWVVRGGGSVPKRREMCYLPNSHQGC